MRVLISFRRSAVAICVATVGCCGAATAQDEAVVKRNTQLRAQPSESAAGVAELPANSVLRRHPQRQGAWLHVQTPAGTSGWVSMFDIGTPVRDLVVGLLRRAVTKPSAGTVATATIGIRGLGQGSLPSGGGAVSRGPAGADVVSSAEQARVSQGQAREFAVNANLQLRKLETLPAPELPASTGADEQVDLSAFRGDGLLSKVLRSPNTVSDVDELELGRQMATIWMQGQPLDETPGLQNYVNRLGRWLSQQSSRPSLPWTFAVVDEADFQAYSAPGGYVFVSRGLLDRCADEAELAGLLAHEIAHVAQRHGLRAMQKAASAEPAIAQNLAALAWHIQRSGMGAPAEFEADRLAVTMVARSGLDPYGLMAALVQQNALNDSDLHYAEAHPQSRLRLDQLEQATAQSGGMPTPSQLPVTIEQRLAALSPK